MTKAKSFHEPEPYQFFSNFFLKPDEMHNPDTKRWCPPGYLGGGGPLIGQFPGLNQQQQHQQLPYRKFFKPHYQLILIYRFCRGVKYIFMKEKKKSGK